MAQLLRMDLKLIADAVHDHDKRKIDYNSIEIGFLDYSGVIAATRSMERQQPVL